MPIQLASCHNNRPSREEVDIAESASSEPIRGLDEVRGEVFIYFIYLKTSHTVSCHISRIRTK